jgi:hypothetical protein
MLPTPETMQALLRTGAMLVVVRDDGIVIEGRSTLGNPVTGSLLAFVAVAGIFGSAEAFQEDLAWERQRESEEHMLELAAALEAYRGSFGAGGYPAELTALLERGLVSDAALLVDPVDPRPRRVRTGTGERVPVSYVLAPVESLPESARDELSSPHATHVLRTRAPWHETWQGESYLVLPLGEDEPWVREIAAEAWR